MIANPQRTYTSLDAAYAHFNEKLFGGQLPPCLITVQRHKGAYGCYFCGNRFISLDESGDVADEIALNPAHFADRSQAETLATLVHEMVHLWQHHFGKPSRRTYHNKEWAAKMRSLGLIPSDTGAPGGHDVGQKMSHYVETGGLFDQACTPYLAKSGAFLYHDRAGDDAGAGTRRKKAASKTKYTCPECGLNAWAKPDAHLLCGDCQHNMAAKAEGTSDTEDSAAKA